MKPIEAPDPECPAEGDGLRVEAGDGHRFRLLARLPERPVAALLWVPALGIAARHYLPFAEALNLHGIAVFVHEWRGHGSSDRRAGHDSDWGYRELLDHDLPASLATLRAQTPGLPHIVGGHSLGGQLAACLLGLAHDEHRDAASRLWLVASGAPYWPVFPPPRRWLLPLAYRFLPWLADRQGALPGRAIGFGGKEARGVMRDWSRTALSGRYAGAGMTRDLEAALSAIATPVQGVLFTDDWLAPRGSLDFLVGKMGPARLHCSTLDATMLGTQADHFAWMRRPEAVAQALAAGLGQPSA